MGAYTQKKLTAVSVCAVVLVCAVIGVALGLLNSKAATPTSDDELAVEAFLLQLENPSLPHNSTTNKTNADKLGINAGDTETWGQYFWFDGDDRLTHIEQRTLLHTMPVYASLHGKIEFAGCTSLEVINLSGNKFTQIDVSTNSALGKLILTGNKLTDLDVSNNAVLKVLYCNNNQITSLDISNNTELEELDCCSNELTSLCVSNSIALEFLCCGNQELAVLDVTGCTALKQLHCYKAQLASLDVRSNESLKSFNCSGNQLTALDLGFNLALESLGCANNQLTSLDVSTCAALDSLDCSDNPDLKSIKVAKVLSVFYLFSPPLGELFQSFPLATSPLADDIEDLDIISLLLLPYTASSKTYVTAELEIGGKTYDFTQEFAVNGPMPQYICAQIDLNNIDDWFDCWTFEGFPLTEIGGDSDFDNASDVMWARFSGDNPDPDSWNIFYCNTKGAAHSNPAEYEKDIGVETLQPLELENEDLLFIGWFDKDGDLWETIPATSTGNIKLWARWLDFSSSDLDKTDTDLVLIGIEEETVDEYNLTFVWYRKVENGISSFVLVDGTTSKQQVIPFKQDPDYYVTYRCEIRINGDYFTHRDKTIPPPTKPSLPDYVLIFSLVGIGILLLLLLLFLILKRRKKDEEGRI